MQIRHLKNEFFWLFVFIILGNIKVECQITYSPKVLSKNNNCTITKVVLTNNETIVTVQVPTSNKKGAWVSFSSSTIYGYGEAESNIAEIRKWYCDYGELDELVLGSGTSLSDIVVQSYTDARKRIAESLENLRNLGVLIRSLGKNALDTRYKLDVKDVDFIYFDLHFNRLPYGVESFLIRELKHNGYEWLGIKIQNPFPTVPNVGYSEEQLRQQIDANNDGIVGIYEGVSSNKYKLACILSGGVYKLVYLNDKSNLKQWTIGDVKAILRPSATPGLFKADWYMANKTLNTDVYVTFGNGAMKTVIDGDEDEFLKMYPTTQSGSNLYGAKEWSGTGFALKNGYVATNYHVIEGAKTIYVQGINGSFSTKVNASVVATDKNNDLAILRIEDSSFKGFRGIPYNVKTSQVDVGEEIFVLGYPMTGTMGDEIKLTTGVISSKTGFQGDVSLYQISAPIQPGNSGGPLFDYKGNLVGVVSAKHAGAENVGYAIKASYLRNLLESCLSMSIMPSDNQVAGQILTTQVKWLKNFVFMITCSNGTNQSSTLGSSVAEGSNADGSFTHIDVQNPQVVKSTNEDLTITRVQVTQEQTIVDFEYDNSVTHPAWVTISPYTYIYNAGIKYTMTKAEGIPIEPEKHYFRSASETLRFRLTFPPLPKDATQFDLIESESSTWKFYGIKLK